MICPKGILRHFKRNAVLLVGVATAMLLIPVLAQPIATTPRPAPSGDSEVTENAAALNGLDFSGLSPEQVAEILEILHENSCNCGCSMDLAECRVKDSKCSRSLAMGKQVISQYRAGIAREKVESDLKTALARSQGTRTPAAPASAPDLNQVFNIDITNSPFKGPESAPVTIVEFSDYQ